MWYIHSVEYYCHKRNKGLIDATISVNLENMLKISSQSQKATYKITAQIWNFQNTKSIQTESRLELPRAGGITISGYRISFFVGYENVLKLNIE